VTEPLEFVAVDIETTGFAATDTVTVVGFAVPMGVRVFCRTDDRPVSDLEATVTDRVDQPVQLSTHASERALLEAVGVFTAERLYDDDVLLVAFNGERWRAGFDLPFLRTRLALTDVAWPFREVPYADLLPVVTHRFNTQRSDGDARTDLVGVYELLCGGDADAVDPFTDSSAAVEAFEDGRFAPLVLHNIADVLRTQELGRLAQRYCSKSDFNLKSLTPTRADEHG
jgi:hypothetical protein